jgi:hypothetical protein
LDLTLPGRIVRKWSRPHGGTLTGNPGTSAQQRGVGAAMDYPPVRDLVAIRMVARAAPVMRKRRWWYERSGSEQVWAAVVALAHSLHGLGLQASPDP